MAYFCIAYRCRELRSYPMSWVFLLFVFRRPDSVGHCVGRYSELIEMAPVLYLYSILRRAFFLRVWKVGQFSVSSIDSTEEV